MTADKKSLFEGCATALVTPFAGGDVDYVAFRRLAERQLEEGIDALVVAGTTGESPTLTDREKEGLFKEAVRAVRGSGRRVPVIGGTGSNNTARAVAMSRMAEAAGCDGLLVVTPYYNKASQEGLVAHFTAIADAVSIPVILYHVPSRTGCGMSSDTCRKLSEHPRIAGLKDATGQIGYTAAVVEACGDALPLYSGNDDMVVPLLSLGGHGVISVVSNLWPRRICEMCRRWREGDVAGARRIQLEILPLFRALFSEVNPIPVKAAMAICGLCGEEVRLPLAAASGEVKERLREILGNATCGGALTRGRLS